MWICSVCGLAPAYFLQVQAATPPTTELLTIRRFQIRYLILASRLATSASASVPASQPPAGSCVISSAVTTPVPPSLTQGLWSESRAAWAASPIVPSLALLRVGARALIWSRNTSSEPATRQLTAPLGCCGDVRLPSGSASESSPLLGVGGSPIDRDSAGVQKVDGSGWAMSASRSQPKRLGIWLWSTSVRSTRYAA
jgi:hypothetical protein